MNWPFGSLMNSKSVISVCVAQPRNASDTVRAELSSSIVFLSLLLSEDATVRQLAVLLYGRDRRCLIQIQISLYVIGPALTSPQL